MPIEVELPDGSVVDFPDGTSDAVMQRAIQQHIGGSKKPAPPVMSRPPPARSDRELFAFNSPYAKEAGLNGLQMLAASAKSVFGGDQAAADYLAEKGGGSVVKDASDGRPILVSPKGQRYNLNDPGFGMSDATNIAGNVAAFAPAARLTMLAPGLGGRMGLGALASGATDAGLQYGTTGTVDPARTALAAAGGGAGELVAPMLGGIVRAWKTGSMSKQELVLKGREQLRRMRDAGNFDDETLSQFGRELDQIAAGGDPRALLSEAEFGFRYTRGQKTGDRAQLNTEERLRNTSGSRSGDILNQNDQFNYSRALEGLDGLQQRITGKPGRVNIMEAVDNAASAVRAEEAALKGRVGDAYTAAGKSNASVGQAAQADLQRRIPKALADVDLDANTPAALRAVEIIRKNMDTRAIGKGDTGPLARSLGQIDQTRKLLRSNFDKAQNPTDRRAVTLIIKEFDTWLDESAAAGLVRGDDSAIKLLKDARGLRTEYGKRFGETGEFATRFDTAVRQMVADGADPETLAKAIYGSSQVSASWANRALLRVDAALGKNEEAKSQLRAAVLTKLVQGKNGEAVGLQALQTNLQTFLTQNPALARNVLGPDGVQKTYRLIASIKPLLLTVDKRSSGTAERLMRYVSDMANGIPLLGPIVQAVSNARQLPQALQAVSPLVPGRPGIVPAVGAAMGANEGR